jgi:hypothetical protein
MGMFSGDLHIILQPPEFPVNVFRMLNDLDNDFLAECIFCPIHFAVSPSAAHGKYFTSGKRIADFQKKLPFAREENRSRTGVRLRAWLLRAFHQRKAYQRQHAYPYAHPLPRAVFI